MKPKLLLFHTSLAIYRIDFFNAVNKRFNASFYFDQKKQLNHSFGEYGENYLEDKCFFKANYLIKGFKVLGRNFKTGIFRILRKENPEIVICYEYSPVTIVTFIYYLISGKRFRMYTISDDSIENSMNRRGLRYFVRHMVSRSIDGIIFPSEDVCNWFKKNISSSVNLLELPIIHNDILFRSSLSESLNKANANIESYRLQEERILLFVGRLIELKNLSFLLKALSKINIREWRFVIVGDGEFISILKKEAVELSLSDKIIFTGTLQGTDLLSWYTISELFILPSVFEQFGAVVNEALLGGCHVMCSDLAGASSLITNDNGILFNPKDEDQLVEKIDKWFERHAKKVNRKQVLRRSNMPFTFEEKINHLFDKIV